MSVLFQIPQYALVAMGELFTSIAGQYWPWSSAVTNTANFNSLKFTTGFYFYFCQALYTCSINCVVVNALSTLVGNEKDCYANNSVRNYLLTVEKLGKRVFGC